MIVTAPVKAAKNGNTNSGWSYDVFLVNGRTVNECFKHQKGLWQMQECDSYIRNFIGFAVVDDYGFLQPVSDRPSSTPYFWNN